MAGQGTFIWDGAINSVLHILLQSFSRRINFHKNFIHNFHLAFGLIRPKICHFFQASSLGKQRGGTV